MIDFPFRRRIRAAFALGMVALFSPAPLRAADPTLPADLSPVGMFLQADLVVKAVMVGLALASLVAWTVLFAKKIEIGLARARLARSLAALADQPGLRAASAGPVPDRIAAALTAAALDEITRAGEGASRDGVKERIALRLQRIEAAATREIGRGVSLLATIGATAPFLGLFGTVWGIMNSFIGISKSQTTNLAVVAPGIAEALLATAIGLVAAIPAVIFYNHLTRAVAGYRAALGDAVAITSVLASRDLDRGPSLRLAAE
ncbi:MAG: tonB-system energizer ExbB [Rhabdaerophilum calidifontis]